MELNVALVHEYNIHDFLSSCYNLHVFDYWIETLACLDISNDAPHIHET